MSLSGALGDRKSVRIISIFIYASEAAEKWVKSLTFQERTVSAGKLNTLQNYRELETKMDTWA